MHVQSDNNICQGGATELATAVEATSCPSLTQLSLGGNNISGRHARTHTHTHTHTRTLTHTHARTHART